MDKIGIVVSAEGQSNDGAIVRPSTFNLEGLPFQPKTMRELRVIGADLGVNVLMPSGVKGTRWLPHVSRALETFLKPGQFTAVKKSMEDATFVAFCHFIADMFSGISKFSLLLQRNEIILPKNILHLVHIMLVLPVSAAVCERGFSAQKRIKSDTRASLHSDTVEDLIRISVEGPSLEDFDARESVACWFSQGQRSRRPNYESWPSEGHVTTMEGSPEDIEL
ncbi:hypothetical protein DNTS_017502 [Danionella cerebrum]|uniref:HAT C-terminal dimerisation domain-containing protein n=1 Tax=Danionella cerebrum TaxID=2873325 RepID=A0A553R8E6_9TELE|nr:hypothetical protein DNTS_017502 [Danionella translucida]